VVVLRAPLSSVGRSVSTSGLNDGQVELDGAIASGRELELGQRFRDAARIACKLDVGAVECRVERVSLSKSNRTRRSCLW
jgi:hypothetical protein